MSLESPIAASSHRGELKLQIMHALPPFDGILAQTVTNEALQGQGRFRPPLRYRLRFAFDNCGGDAVRIGPGKRLRVRQHLIQYGAKGEDVAAGVRLRAFDLLGRHVWWGSEDRALLR
jgi:hypothetical protein